MACRNRLLPLLPRTESTTSIATTVPISRAGSVADLDTLNVDLGAFFDNRPFASAAPVTSTAPSGSGATVSAPPTPDCSSFAPSIPPPTGALKDFLDRLGLADLPSKDKRFNGKVEARQTQRELHQLAQQSGRIYADLEQHRVETMQICRLS
ncbi:hypothetical protein B0H13DRAFT_2563117 [Mycena leptocephala]|nr:hypothetical protein B0H13DRAFT_2563117 [Mycena leptocephala]